MRFIFSIFIILVIPTLSFSQPLLTWQDITGLIGFNTIQIGDSGTFFSTNQRGVVYQSFNEGVTWEAILAYPSHDPIDELVVNGSHVAVRMSVLDFSDSNQLFRWDNDAFSWTRIFSASPLTNPYQWLMIDDDGRIYAVSISEGQLYRYEPISRRWVKMGNKQAFLSPIFNGVNYIYPTIVPKALHNNLFYFASSMGGLYISQDTGKTWKSSLTSYSITAFDVTSPDTIVVGASLDTDLRTNGGVFVSTDSGQTWAGLGLDGMTITSLASDENGNLLALADGDIYKYNPTTKVWDISNHAENAFTTLVRYKDSFIASNEVAGFYRSFDGGMTWAGALLRGRDIFSMKVTQGGSLLVGTLGQGIYRTQLGNSFWTTIPSEATGDYIYDFTNNGGAVIAGTNDGVYRSTDDGQHWMNINDSTLSGPAYAVNSLSDGTILAATLFGIYQSNDSDYSWQRLGSHSSKVLFMDVSPSDDILASGDGGVYLSTNRGQVWQSLALTRDDIQCVKFTPKGDFLIGVYGGVFLSTDRGASWNYHSVNPSAYTYALKFSESQMAYAGTYQGVFVSPDGGVTWSPAGDSGLATKVVLALDLAQDRSLLAGTYRGGVYKSNQTASTFSVDDVKRNGSLPLSISLEQNYPNPFNPTTNFKFQTTKLEFVSLKVFDIVGKNVATIVNEVLPPGLHDFSWNATSIASGIYFYKLQSQSATLVKKMVLVK